MSGYVEHRLLVGAGSPSAPPSSSRRAAAPHRRADPASSSRPRASSRRTDYSVRAAAGGRRRDRAARSAPSTRCSRRSSGATRSSSGRATTARGRANRAKDEFLATLSHELRTPLNAILGWTRMLRAAARSTPTAGAARRSRSSSATRASQAQLIEDLLDVSRIIAGKLRLDVQPVELAPWSRRRSSRCGRRPSAKGIRLAAVLDPRVGARRRRPDRLQQVVWNLLSNAIKFTPKGGRVQVAAAARELARRDRRSATRQGIAPEFLPHVFERFRQADSSSRRACTAASVSGSRSCATSSSCTAARCAPTSAGDGQGATFTVELPLSPSADARRSTERVHPTAADDRAARSPPRRSTACACWWSTTSPTRCDTGAHACSRRTAPSVRPRRRPRRRSHRSATGARTSCSSRHRDAGRGRLRAHSHACAQLPAGAAGRFPRSRSPPTPASRTARKVLDAGFQMHVAEARSSRRS